MTMRLALAVLLLGMSLGCHKRAAKVTPPPAPSAPDATRPAETPAQQPPASTQPVPAIPPPETAQQPVEIPSVQLPGQTPAPPKPPRRTPPPPPKPKPVPAPAAPPPAQVPQLAQVLTEAERQEHARATGESLARARGYVAALRKSPLTAEEQAGVARVEGLIRQAEEAAATDPVTARTLAQRAEMLARDLMR